MIKGSTRDSPTTAYHRSARHQRDYSRHGDKTKQRQLKLGFIQRSTTGRKVNPYAQREPLVTHTEEPEQPKPTNSGRCETNCRWGLLKGTSRNTMKHIGEYIYSSRQNVDASDDAIVQGCGDDPTPGAQHQDMFRIYYQNICGLKLQKSTNTLVETVGFLSQFRAALVGLVETNTNWKQVESDRKSVV